jgi:hypothetical protein
LDTKSQALSIGIYIIASTRLLIETAAGPGTLLSAVELKAAGFIVMPWVGRIF